MASKGYTAKLTFTAGNEDYSFMTLARRLAQLEIAFRYACNCGHCASIRPRDVEAVKRLPCRKAAQLWLLTYRLLRGKEVYLGSEERIHSLSELAYEHPLLAFEVEYIALSWNGGCGHREWYSEGRCAATQAGQSVVTWGEKIEKL